MKRRKHIDYVVEFINDDLPKENLEDILLREFVRFANEKKGFTFLTLNKNVK
ncbi:hypothetical protein [Cytobacillus horneckiae]|uniref:hypothetical protein n=1 Tax=Cytobacillus horneckiae TaxID=549687 RepID=UPI000A6A9878|nr:hypothetical protein [Cytobacillus horneckiae]MEC1155023.1 hypothetical protein [Cytobacillus horneckiae]MED2936071.1 hypothetical protein [Cytobacillus horneckiae]